MTTPNGSPELTVGQASKEETVNEQVRRTERGANHYLVVDKDLSTPPGSCADGATYIVASSPTGAWVGHAGDLAVAVGTNAANGWYFRDPEEGITAWVQDENATYRCDLGTSPATWTLVPANQTESFIIAASDETTALTTGTAKVTFRMPYAFTLTSIKASLSTAQTSGGQVTVDVNESGSSIISPKLIFDNGSKTTVGSSPSVTITDANLAADAEITIDIDNIGDGTAKGLKVTLIGSQP